MPDHPDDRLLLSIRDAARRMSVPPRSLERLLASGELPSVKIGTRRLVSVRASETWIAEQEDAA